MEDSPIPADKWLTAVWLLSNCKNGISSYEIASAIGVTQKSAWFMMHRIRFGLSLNRKRFGTNPKIGGGENEVEVEETFIGGQKKTCTWIKSSLRSTRRRIRESRRARHP